MECDTETASKLGSIIKGAIQESPEAVKQYKPSVYQETVLDPAVNTPGAY